MIQGTGQISADGGSSLSYRGGGGGGRVTIYPYRGMTLPPASITAGGGTGGHGTAQAGTISILESPYLAWNGGSTLLHGTTGLAWTALGINPSTTDVDISAYYGRPQGLVIAAGQPISGNFAWDTTTVPDESTNSSPSSTIPPVTSPVS